MGLWGLPLQWICGVLPETKLILLPIGPREKHPAESRAELIVACIENNEIKSCQRNGIGRLNPAQTWRHQSRRLRHQSGGVYCEFVARHESGACYGVTRGQRCKRQWGEGNMMWHGDIGDTWSVLQTGQWSLWSLWSMVEHTSHLNWRRSCSRIPMSQAEGIQKHWSTVNPQFRSRMPVWDGRHRTWNSSRNENTRTWRDVYRIICLLAYA